LRDRVRDQIFFDPFIDGSRMRVAVEDNAAVLTGTVKSEWARQRAIRNAYEGGARRVVDRLRIAP
jgi:osmotically-inducible protein OsmY